MGKIASPYGVRGWTKVISFTDPIDNLLAYKSWNIQHNREWKRVSIEKGKVHGKWLIVKLAGCEDRDCAQKYTNNLIAIAAEARPILKSNEFYWSDLIGLQVINTTGVIFGLVHSLMETGANDVLVVKDKNNRQILIPYLNKVVKSIDLKEKKIIVDWEFED